MIHNECFVTQIITTFTLEPKPSRQNKFTLSTLNFRPLMDTVQIEFDPTKIITSILLGR